MAAGAAGLPPLFFEGAAGGAALALGVRHVLSNLRTKENTFDWDVMNTDVPEQIAENNYMTVVSNPDNGPGVVVWDRETGYEVGVFDSQEIRDSVWLTSDEEVDAVSQLLAGNAQDRTTTENN